MPIIPLVQRSDFDCTSLAAGTTMVIPVLQAIDIAEYGTGTVLFRGHAAQLPAGASVRLELRVVAPTAEDPAQFFRGQLVASAELVSGVTVPALAVGPALLRAGAVGAFLRVRQGPSGGTLTFTVSADLACKMACSSWSPLDLGSKLKLWLDQRDQVVVSGAISDWGDQSAANNDFNNGVAASRPASGDTINTQAAPSFDGANDFLDLATGGAMTAIASASAYHAFVVVRIDAITLNQGNPYDNHVILGDTGAFWTLAVGTPGVQGVNFDGGTKATPPIPVVTGLDYLIEWSFDGTTVRCRVGSGATQSIASGNISNTTFTPRLGRGWSSSGFLDGAIGAVVCSNVYLSPDEVANVRAFLSSTYGVPS